MLDTEQTGELWLRPYIFPTVDSETQYVKYVDVSIMMLFDNYLIDVVFSLRLRVLYKS